MAEEHQTLVQNEFPQGNGEEVGSRGPRFMTCNRGQLVTALSVFVGILIVGQAVTVYFVTQQHAKISDLDATMNRMKLEELIKKLPGSPPAKDKPKMRMATLNIPLLAKDTQNPTENLEDIAKASNKIEDAVKYSLLRRNPLRKYPSLNGTILDNLRQLRKTMEDEKWAVFDAWMQQWYLFYLVQNTPAGNKPGDNGLLTSQERDHPLTEPLNSRNVVFATTSYSKDSLSSFNGETPSGEPLLTVCQIKASAHVHLGAYKPQCDESGEFLPMQCWRGTGYCWCVYRNGTEVPETRTRAKPDCNGILEPSDRMDEYYRFSVKDE